MALRIRCRKTLGIPLVFGSKAWRPESDKSQAVSDLDRRKRENKRVTLIRRN